MTEPSTELVAARLADMAERSRQLAASPEGRTRMREHLQEVRRTAVVDMAPQAVDARIRRMAAMRRLCLELGRVRQP